MRDDQSVRANQPVAAEAPVPRRPPRPAVPRKSAEVRDASFFSVSLQREMQYRLLLPESYVKGSKSYPVLYLLHGVFGDHTNWDSLTEVAQYVQPLELIVAMPDGDNSWYTNSATAPRDRFEDYIVEDFVAEVESRYRVVSDRAHRAVAGLSMGGYAAVKFALKYPERFAFAGSISGAFDATRNLHERRADLRERLLEVFGRFPSKAAEANDVFLLAEAADPQTAPYLYLDCGTEDEFVACNRELAAQLARRGFRHHYVEASGGHEWPYWDRRIAVLLPYLAERLTNRSPRTQRRD